jgi:hypothetical protein
MPSVTDVHPTTERLHALDALSGRPAATSSAIQPPASIAMTVQRNAGLDAINRGRLLRILPSPLVPALWRSALAPSRLLLAVGRSVPSSAKVTQCRAR